MVLRFSLCDTALSSVNTQRASNLHEIASVTRDWQSKLGEPELLSNPTYVQRVQFIPGLKVVTVGGTNNVAATLICADISM
jgi:hypothetical protein